MNVFACAITQTAYPFAYPQSRPATFPFVFQTSLYQANLDN